MDALLAAARLGDPVAHTASKGWMIAGMIGGALLGAAAIALTGGTALIALAAVAAGAAAGGGIGEVLGTMSWAPRHVTGSLISGSPNVFVNSRSAMRAHISTGLCSDHSGQPKVVAQGSSTVFINGQPAARQEDLLTCGAVISGGSPNVFIGGSQTTTDEISPEVPAWLNWAMLAVGVAAATILAGPLVAALGTVGGLAGGEVGSLVGGHFFGEGSDGQKWSMLGGGLLGGMAGAKGGAALEGRFFPEPAVVPSEIPESNPDFAPRSGGNPALAGDPFSPDAVNARSAEFYKLYGDNPQRGTMSNVEARQWYLAEDAKIPDQLDPTASYESQAQQSFDLRNANRSGARELMSDRITADRLTREEPNRSWDDLVASKQAAGLSGDDVYKSIISSSQKTRVSVNKQLGLD